MGRLTDALKKLAKKTMSQPLGRPDDGLGDFETRDKYLKSLRRQRRRQFDVVEKEKLKKQISSFEHKRNTAMFNDKGIISIKNKKIVKISSKGFLGKTKL